MTPPQTIGVVAGIALFVAGFVLLAVARRLDGGLRSWVLVGPVSKATETAAGLALVFAGYHVVAYGGPPGWVTFHVPTSLGWLVFVAGGGAVAGCLLADRVLGHVDDLHAESDAKSDAGADTESGGG